ncbi:hypothetical protein [Flavicella marina]|nr:hypothetical protein [Flavicella marina]
MQKRIVLAHKDAIIEKTGYHFSRAVTISNNGEKINTVPVNNV